MGDMGDYYRDMDYAKKQKKIQNMKDNMEYLHEINANFISLNGSHQLNFRESFGVISFYPTTNKWVYKNQVFYGNAEKLMKWIKDIKNVI